MSLNESAEQWADIILEKQKDFVRRDTAMEIAEQGYEIKKAAKQFEKYYLEMNQKN